MNIAVKIEGLDKLTKLTGDAQKNLVKELAEGIREGIFVLEGGAKRALTEGETRAIKTGRLRADTVVRQITPTFATLYPIVDYAIFVHFWAGSYIDGLLIRASGRGLHVAAFQPAIY